jgi:hypothetical protein
VNPDRLRLPPTPICYGTKLILAVERALAELFTGVNEDIKQELRVAIIIYDDMSVT